MSLSHLKRNSSSSFDKLNQELTKLNSKNSSNDDSRYWKLTTDKAGNGYAIIRFLPEIEGEDLPFTQIFNHSFQGPGGWYIEKSLSTLGQPDPCGEENSRLWNTGLDADKELARNRKRKLKYHSNIYVVKDPANPENEGKVFLFSYGKKLFDKLKDVMNPAFEDEKPMNPFDFWKGANFKLKQRVVDGWPNYDKSEFDDVGPLFEDDDKLEEVYTKQYSLKELTDPKHFKSYEQLKQRLDRVLGNSGTTTSSAPEEDEKVEPKQEREKAPAKMEEKSSTFDSGSDDDDEDLAFFKSLADDND